MNNKSIQILRGTRKKLIEKQNDNSLKLKDGQLLYNKTDNYISVGNDSDNSLLKDPIAVKELHGNFSPTSTNTSYDYYIKNNSDNNLELYSENSDVINKAPTLSTGIARKKEVDNETARAKSEESRIEIKLNGEIDRSTTFDNSHNNIENHDSGSRLKDSFNSCGLYKSFLYGYHLTATSDYQAIFGQYNDVSSTAPDNKTILAVGGGNSSERKNLFEVSSTASKFNTKLKVSGAPTETNDVLRWGDLTTSQDNSGGTYLTKIEFDGKTLKYEKGSPFIPYLSITSSPTNKGDVVTNITNNNHAVTVTYGNTSGSVTADSGYYVDKVSLSGLTLSGTTKKIPDVVVTQPPIKRTFVSSISSDGHGITYSMDDIDGHLPTKGSKNTPIYTLSGSFYECRFTITCYDSTTGSEVKGKSAIAIYV